MNVLEIFLFSFDALRDRKVRSILTILMVMAGSSLLVAVNGFSAGFTQFFENQFNNLAPNIIFVSKSVNIEQELGADSGGNDESTNSEPKIVLNSAVINRINSLPFVQEVIPSFQTDVIIDSNGKLKSDAILSMDPNKLFVIVPTLEFFDGSNIQPNNPSTVLLAENISFPPGEENPFATLGQTIKITYSFVDSKTGQLNEESKNFVVSGIMKTTGNPTIDNAVVINLNAGNSLLQKSNKYDSLFVVADSSNNVDIVVDSIRDLYGNNIGITTVQAILKTFEEFTSGINAFLMSIAVISLIVGAVGIITTLYTSVVERIREIGTLKAIGAQNFHILIFFLIEALIIGIFGASFGLVAGIGGGYMLTQISPSDGDPITPLYPIQNLFSVWLISVSLSIMAGIFPAWKASKLNPIDALRS